MVKNLYEKQFPEKRRQTSFVGVVGLEPTTFRV